MAGVDQQRLFESSSARTLAATLFNLRLKARFLQYFCVRNQTR